ARIKKLIQADEDVGKVAQATPVLVSKALELFLTSLVNECVKDAKERGTKKITAYGLKRTVTQTPTFDFCADIVEGVPDPITPVEDDEEGGGKKKRARKPRQPKDEDGDDSEEKPKKKRKSVKKSAEPVPKAEEADEDEEGDDMKPSTSGGGSGGEDEEDEDYEEED
ncbi:hypothetical protein T439DRAFT_287218, partial [Meredithblackwellia eburnea MCA 4105]